ncbi:MAG TPA: prepilin-type N-terminal cleavage/methylation domain-containing protein [Candidatus Ozemobacteraceae bacterium]|nr:prepilin-type N-terminal cleavage/methylation domain-containing protein [Candidatus Ozemobacteraceae bacterium]
MFQAFNRKVRGFTLTEIIIGMAILIIIFSIVMRWFLMQRGYQQRITQIADTQDRFRLAVWNMVQELQTGRVIIWPRLNSDKSIRSDTKVVFKNMLGEIVTFYHIPEALEIRRCVIPPQPGLTPQLDERVVGTGIASVSFTARDIGNRLIDIHLQASGVHTLDAVYLLNED